MVGRGMLGSVGYCLESQVWAVWKVPVGSDVECHRRYGQACSGSHWVVSRGLARFRIAGGVRTVPVGSFGKDVACNRRFG